MSVLRGLGLWLSRSLLITFLITSILLSGATSVINEDNIKSAISSALDSQLISADSDLNKAYESFLLQCRVQAGSTVTYPIKELKVTLEFNCNDLRLGGIEGFKENFKDQLTIKFLEQGSQEELCEGYDCIKAISETKNPARILNILTSENFNAFLSKISITLMVLAVLSGIALVLLGTGIAGRFLVLGYPLTIAGLPYLGMNFIRSNLRNALPSQILPIITEFISSISGKYLTVLILGVVLLVIGAILKYGLKIDEKTPLKKKK